MADLRKILIANRGEIACRIIKTARRMGIATVAVYSEADRHAVHVRLADEAVAIGSSPAAESYLVVDKIIQACQDTGADAVHPGYGFLSENPGFAKACAVANITFIGPAPESMEAMGLKDAAKKLMSAADVPVTPGYHGENQETDYLAEQAASIGYPVLIKAVAGGGGKGMRKVETAADFTADLKSCQREAASSFGDDRVLIEKYITAPRHIEVQVFGDTHGNVIHLFERDCSLQRRHQKVIEEAPAPGMSEDVRQAMTHAAIQAAKAVSYVGAGTVEFIVDGSAGLRSDGFWFMEMNTRLQVEHPVTEMITGLDLVEWQIRVAQGEALPDQNDITLSGHAIEARLYAEDPANDFLPSIGKIRNIDLDEWDDASGTLRIDSGVENGSDISIYYDPMIAKIISHADTKAEAVETLLAGIEEIEATGVTTNSGFLYRCLQTTDFLNGAITTSFIPDRIKDLTTPAFLERDEVYALAALKLEAENQRNQQSSFDVVDGWRMNLPRQNKYYFDKKGDALCVEIRRTGDTFATLNVGDGEPITISYETGQTIEDNISALSYYREWAFKVLPDSVSLTRQGDFIRVPFIQFDTNQLARGGDAIIAPMPGNIITVHAQPGDTVKAGDPLIVMEAMKMEMTLDAPRNGTVATIDAKAGKLVADGDVLLSLEKEKPS